MEIDHTLLPSAKSGLSVSDRCQGHLSILFMWEAQNLSSVHKDDGAEAEF